MSKLTITKQQEAPLSKAQKQFNQLNSQIAKEKEQLLKWQNTISNFKNIFTNEMVPLQNKFDKLRAQTVYFLDEIYDKKMFTKRERKKMRYVIEVLADELAHDDEKVKEIYNKRSNNDFDKEQAIINEARAEQLKDVLFEECDIDLEDVDINDPEKFMQEFMKQMQGKMDEQQEQENIKQQSRKKNSKTLNQEAKEIKQEQEVSQSIKEVYRQLAKTLHPDRELDPIERERKTELMQKVNIAYNKNDLLALLQMQLEIEQIDQNSINSMSIEKVKHYNIILKRQIEEIEQEIDFTCKKFQMEFGRQLNVPMFGVISSPDWIIPQLKKEMTVLEDIIQQTEIDLNTWQDHSTVKAYLKTVKVLPKNTDYTLRL